MAWRSIPPFQQFFFGDQKGRMVRRSVPVQGLARSRCGAVGVQDRKADAGHF